MSEHRRVVVFGDGTPNERPVVFNEGAPTQTQDWAGGMFRFIVMVSGSMAVGLGFMVTAYFAAHFAATAARDAFEGMVLMFAGIAAACFKIVLPLTLKAANDRGEVAATYVSAGLLAVCALFGFIATSQYLAAVMAIGNPNDMRPLVVAVRQLYALPVAFLLELVIIGAPFAIMIGAKAHSEVYERPVEVDRGVVAEPAFNSFEAGFSRWAIEALSQDATGRVSGDQVRKAYENWALYNGPYNAPSAVAFGRKLAEHMRALGAISSATNGRVTYSGVKLGEQIEAPKLPAIMH
jgi:hypothetical protein